MTQDETAQLLRPGLPRGLQESLDVVRSNKDSAISRLNKGGMTDDTLG
jgi:hypothetical protein